MDEVQQPHVERMAIDYSYGDFLTVVRLAEENGRVDKERVEQMLQKMPSRKIHSVSNVVSSSAENDLTRSFVPDAQHGAAQKDQQPPDHTSNPASDLLLLNDAAGSEGHGIDAGSLAAFQDRLQNIVDAVNSKYQFTGDAYQKQNNHQSIGDNSMPSNITFDEAQADAEMTGVHDVVQHKSPQSSITSTAILTPAQMMKSRDALCVRCWHKGLDCDHQIPCKQCLKESKRCVYVRCPLTHCTAKCPAFHAPPDYEMGGRIGDPMHLIALVQFTSKHLDHYDLRPLRKHLAEGITPYSIYHAIRHYLDWSDARPVCYETIMSAIGMTEGLSQLSPFALSDAVLRILLFLEDKEKHVYRKLWKHEGREATTLKNVGRTVKLHKKG